MLFLSFIFIACTSEIKKPKTIDGVLEQLGYGRIVKIDDGEYIIAIITSISCIPLKEVQPASEAPYQNLFIY